MPIKYVEGTNRYQPTMLPQILDDYVDENNPARVIDAFVDSLDLVEMSFAFLAFNLKQAINIIGAKELIRQISLA